MGVQFTDNSEAVKSALEESLIRGLHGAAGEVMSQAADNSPIDTGALKGDWKYYVDEKDLVATIGNTKEYSIYQEFGTGEYALEGNGRKGGWFYKDAEGKGHFTHGNKPIRMLYNAFVTKKNAILNIIEQELKSGLR